MDHTSVLSLSLMLCFGFALLLLQEVLPLKEDPEVYMNVSQLITSKGYPCEEYTVETQDGFLLGVQRIPYGRTKAPARGPVFLQHGLLCASTNWVTNLANESLGFLLADQGYDVWLGNVRGNTYSRRHVKYKPSSEEFWAFSWDEMALLDLPAMIDFALQRSGHNQLYYIGHSQGTLIAFAKLSQDPTYARKVKVMIAMGPVATVGNIKSPIRYLSYLTPEIKDLFDLFGVHAFLPSGEIIHDLADIFCEPPFRFICANVIFLLSGYDVKQLNMTRLPVYVHHAPAGTSVQNMVHFAQMVRSGKFQRYDFGSYTENMKHYGMAEPPLFHPENITAPVYLFWGENDWLADPKDVEQLAGQLKVLKGNYGIPEWDHLDFIWGMDAPQLVYSKVMKIMADHPL